MTHQNTGGEEGVSVLLRSKAASSSADALHSNIKKTSSQHHGRSARSFLFPEVTPSNGRPEKGYYFIGQGVQAIQSLKKVP